MIVKSWYRTERSTTLFVGILKDNLAMALKLAPIVLGILHVVAASPAFTLKDLEMADDTMSVATYVREARAVEPQNYDKSYQNEGDGEIGYSRKKAGGGKKGYQHFDSYHKKAGDNYEFEKQDSYGHDDEGHDGAHSHNHEKKAEKYREPQSDETDEAEEEEPRRPAEEQKHIHHDELKEGASDGNGGVEANGHDPADYILPEKYTYGDADEDEYNF